jgi:hypothetical protein
MLTELPHQSFDCLPLVFSASEHSLVIRSIAARHNPALAWVDNITQPSVALVWDRAGGLYLAGLPAQMMNWAWLPPQNIAGADWQARYLLPVCDTAWHTATPQFGTVGPIICPRPASPKGLGMINCARRRLCALTLASNFETNSDRCYSEPTRCLNSPLHNFY